MSDGGQHGWLSVGSMYIGQSMAICGVTCSNEHVTLFKTAYKCEKNKHQFKGQCLTLFLKENSLQ